MKKRICKNNSLFKKMFLPIVAALLAQTLIYSLLFLQGGFMTTIENNTYEMLYEQVKGRKQYLENDMIHRWSNLTETENNILATVDQVLSEQGKTYADIRTDEQLNEQLVLAVADDIIYTLRRNSVSSAFVVFDGAGIAGDRTSTSYAGLYVRDSDPASNPSGNSDLLIERGLPSVSKQLGIALDSYWNASFTLQAGKEGSNFFFNPLNAAKAALVSEKRDSTNFAYWSREYCLSEQSGNRMISYTLPLIASDGTVIGVLGIGVSQSYLQSLMSYRELSSTGAGAYVFGRTSDGGETIQPMFVAGPAYKVHYSGMEPIETENISEHAVSLLGERRSGDRVMGSVQQFSLYNTNSPFAEEQYVLVGLMDSGTLMSFPNQIRTFFYWLVLAAILLGLAGALIASRMVTKPIHALVGELKKSDPNHETHLQKLNVEEIDELTIAIENLSHKVAESASKISQIITMTGMKLGVFEYQMGSEKVYCSDGLAELLGFPPDLLCDSLMARERFQELMEMLQPQIYDKENIIYKLSSPGGEVRFIQLRTMQMGDGHLGTVTDVTKEMTEKLQIEYERDFDILTGLYNLRAFRTRVGVMFKDPERLGGVACVIMWDLDNLKYINDTYGHEYGDRYIQTLAANLETFKKYGGLNARRSGDEFYTFLYGSRSEGEMRQIIRKVWAQISNATMSLPDGAQMKIRVSAGIAWYPRDAVVLSELAKFADFAMYNVKHSQKGAIQDFNRALYTDSGFLVDGQEQLNRLIEEQLVDYAMQPVLEVATGSVFGYELLMRPQVPAFRTPIEVLRIAHAQSKLHEIERLTWFKGMESFVRQAARGAAAPGTRVLINSIANQRLTAADTAVFVRQYAPYLSRIVLEITEGDPLNERYTAHKAEIIKKSGGLVAIDDFGSGYSSESVLLSVKPDLVKLDISLVRDIDHDPAKQLILDNMIKYARMAGGRVLAEGVETKAEMITLVSAGVDYLQGFYVAGAELEPPPISQAVLDAVRQAYETTKNAP